MQNNAKNQGLTQSEVESSRAKHGRNMLYVRTKSSFFHMLKEVVIEPMFLLLGVTCILYFILGDQAEAWMMVGSVVFVIAIELIQEFRSEKALNALRAFSQPNAQVFRDGKKVTIPTDEVVVGDLLLFAEGERVAADGLVLEQHDLSIDEAVLTGESMPVVKKPGEEKVFQGTTVVGGQGMARVEFVGNGTEFGKLGKSIESIEAEKTPLQIQINRFVRQMVLAGLAAFVVVFFINLKYTGAWIPALIYSLAFGMALIPEEIPVAFSTFMALGAYRMTKKKVLVKQPRTVESLGSATVICLDKTGTITQNLMQVAEVLDFSKPGDCLFYAALACEAEPFDSMEKAILEAYKADRVIPNWTFTHEYPLGGVPPMMTHLYKNDLGEIVVAGKGAVERILLICSHLTDSDRTKILKKTHEMASKGYRVLGVSSATWNPGEAYPQNQDAFAWNFEGLLALYDPPKPNMKGVFKQFYDAGIKVKMITGDYPETALNIARESGMNIGSGTVCTGEALMAMNEDERQLAVRDHVVFARMFPDAKLKIVEALKKNGEVVAMTGDGVNDGPALKSAQIGVAMGQKGTEIAKSAASMVLLDDDLKHMVTAVRMGRKIYANLHKAIRYIISIHLPIILVVLVPLVFGWPYLHMLTPIHVIFLELIMDPTCAVAFENEPEEKGQMQRAPRPQNQPLFTWKQLSMSLIQGIAITAGVFTMYHLAIYQGKDENETRSFVFATLMASNIMLTLVNRSEEHTLRKTLFYKNNIMYIILAVATSLMLVILFFPPARSMFKMGVITLQESLICIATAFVSVAWYELWKILSFRRKNNVMQ
ncbi:MAG: cation-translocating P-type ATPase [Saprospiraceae bacterium]|nr:cation-translocating P-type ATPase [Saprospiraceae bacterium]